MNSIGNTVSAAAGILGPIIVASLTTNIGDDSNNNPWGWRIAFLLTLFICIIVSTVWYIMIKAEIVNELNTPSPIVVKNK
jgi:MFS family permease